MASSGDIGRPPPTPFGDDTIDVTLAAEKLREAQQKIDRFVSYFSLTLIDMLLFLD